MWQQHCCCSQSCWFWRTEYEAQFWITPPFILSLKYCTVSTQNLCMCPGFGWDSVNFHKKSGGDTAGMADPNWPSKVGYSMPCAIIHSRVWGRELSSGRLTTVGEHAGHWAVRELLCVFPWGFFSILFISIIVVTVHFLGCSVKLSSSWHRNFAFFFPFSTTAQQGEGW